MVRIAKKHAWLLVPFHPAPGIGTIKLKKNRPTFQNIFSHPYLYESIYCYMLVSLIALSNYIHVAGEGLETSRKGKRSEVNLRPGEVEPWP